MALTESSAKSTHADQVRQRILDGAARAFSSSGFQGTSVPEIAAEVGVSVGLLYRYFPSKADLFTAICASEMASETGALAQRLSEIPNPTARLRQAVEFYLRQLQQNRGAGVILGALAEAQSNQDVRRVMQLRASTIRQFVSSYLKEGVSSGELPAATPVNEFTEAIAMMLDGVVGAWAVLGPDLDVARVGDAIVSLLAAALQTPAAPAR
ncbi:MAG: TetR/AcrR family transcriptional regulator [Candidatus Dormibacteria bacterium]